MGAGASVIAEIVPDVNEMLPDLKSPPELDSPEQARFRLFDATATFLKNVSHRSDALVLILEDLHWADKPSLLLLEFLVQELSEGHLMVVGTYRDAGLSRQHPLAETLGELTRSRPFQRVALRGLSLEDEGELIHATSGAQRNQEFVEMIHSRTDGNPLFTGEVLRMLKQEGGVGWEDAGFRIPEGVREVIGRRLNRLTERCNQALTVAFVIGREFEFSLLTPLVEGMSGDELLESLEEALSVRVIEEFSDTEGRYQFTHKLIRNTLAEELSLTRRTRLHARVAETLEQLYGAEAQAHAAELAHHFSQAETVLGTEALVRYSILAAERAIVSYTYEEAKTHFDQAMKAKTGQGVDSEMAAILFGLGRAQVATYVRDEEARQAVSNLSRAFDYYDEVGDVDRALPIAQIPPTTYIASDPKFRRLVTRTLELAPTDSHHARALLQTSGLELGLRGADYEGARDTFDRAIAIARRTEDAALEMSVLSQAARVDWYHLRFQQCLDRGLAAIDLAYRVNDVSAEVRARVHALGSQVVIGDLEGARQHAPALVSVAEKSRLRSRLAMALALNADLSRFEGDWRKARKFSDRALTEGPLFAHILGPRVLLEYDTGEFNQGEAYLKRLLKSTRRSTPGRISNS
tara:strand:+ start:7965 stop:9869 length:1905 start_codon:yes stop_codon:yes gene_type:complete